MLVASQTMVLEQFAQCALNIFYLTRMELSKLTMGYGSCCSSLPTQEAVAGAVADGQKSVVESTVAESPSVFIKELSGFCRQSRSCPMS